MLSRRGFTLSLLSPVLFWPQFLWAQAGEYLIENEAPPAVFPHATAFERQVVPSTPALRDRMQALLGAARPSLWEPQYIVYTARQNEILLGYAVIVEEIGKHQPITFIVGVRPDGTVQDVAVMVYREPYGGEVRYGRFLAQYEGKTLHNRLLPYRDIRNVTGATLSAHSIGRGVRKALALVQTVFLTEP